MGLGATLLDTDRTVARLKRARGGGPGAPAMMGAEPVAPLSGEVSFDVPTGGSLTDESGTADFVILWPALGCPQLVHPVRRSLEIIFLSKKDEKDINVGTVQDLIKQVMVVDWNKARQAYTDDGGKWNPTGPTLDSAITASGITIKTKKDLTTYRKEIKDKPFEFGELVHTMADFVPKVYLNKGFKSIVSAALPLKAQSGLTTGKMYDLYYAPENGLLRDILDSTSLLEKPYGDIPVMRENGTVKIGGSNQVHKGRTGDKQREHLVRLLHPLWLVEPAKADYLNVGHITDMHTSTLWDFFDKKIFPNFPQDTSNVTTLRDPRTNADSAFELVANRFNNPNLNYRSLTQTMNARAGADKFVDLILQTGDLVDYNRGFNHNAAHNPDKDYVFNLNWIRFYELMLQDYERPIYTSLGNHDWRLNPYPPRVKPEGVHVLLLLYFIFALSGTGTGVGGVFGAFEGTDNPSSAGIKAFEFFMAPIMGTIGLFAFLLLLGGIGINLDVTSDVLFSSVGWWIVLVGSAFGLLVQVLLWIVNAKGDSRRIHDTGSGMLWGTLMGGSLGSLLMIIVFFYVLFKQPHVDYMKHITNLLSADFFQLLENKNVASLNAFGEDGMFNTTERAYDWYTLVINPFQDYAFRHGNMSFLMADWGGSEVLTGDPPFADDEFTDRQWKLVDHWIQWAVLQRNALKKQGITADQKQVVPIIGLHTPVFCPELKTNLDDLNHNDSSADDGDLKRGTMEEHRKEFIDKLYQLAHGTYPGSPDPIAAISLTGHTHTYDIFRMESPNQVKWYQSSDVSKQPAGFWDSGLHITTACSGPPADSKGPGGDDDALDKAMQTAKPLLGDYESRQDNAFDAGNTSSYYKAGDRVMRPGGARVVVFDKQTGKIKDIEEVSAPTAKYGDA